MVRMPCGASVLRRPPARRNPFANGSRGLAVLDGERTARAVYISMRRSTRSNSGPESFEVSPLAIDTQMHLSDLCAHGHGLAANTNWKRAEVARDAVTAGESESHHSSTEFALPPSR